jgi:hypothetical protein
VDLTAAGLITVVLSSSLLSALLSAVASQLLSSSEYQRDYHREVVRRRLEAYERVQRVIGMLRRVVHKNGRVAHMAFDMGADGVIELTGSAMLAMEDLWLDPDVRDILVQINREILKVPTQVSREEIFTAGEGIYISLGKLREALEVATCESLRNLHRIDLFLRRKRDQAAMAVHRVEHLPVHPEDRER